MSRQDHPQSCREDQHGYSKVDAGQRPLFCSPRIASTRAVMLATILIAAKKAASKSTSRGMLNRPRSWLDFKVSLQPAAEMLVATRLAMSSKNCDMNSEFTAVTNRGTDFR